MISLGSTFEFASCGLIVLSQSQVDIGAQMLAWLNNQQLFAVIQSILSIRSMARKRERDLLFVLTYKGREEASRSLSCYLKETLITYLFKYNSA